MQPQRPQGKMIRGPSPSGKSVEYLIVARIHGVSGCIANELSGYSGSRLSEEIDVTYSATVLFYVNRIAYVNTKYCSFSEAKLRVFQ